MTKSQLRLLAIVLTGLILVVVFAGLDDLPRRVRAEIASEQQSLIAAEKQAQKARAEIAADLQAEPALFRVRSLDTALPARLTRAESNLLAARRDMQALDGLAKANRRADREKAERLLREERNLRTSAAEEASAAAREAQHWMEIKQHLPEQVAQMGSDYQALRRADLLKLTAVVQKAENDWPEKKGDLESRLVTLVRMPADAERQWQATAEMRRKVAANDPAGVDYAALLGAADAVHQESVELPQKSAEVEKLSGQLYDSWDKILVDLKRGDQPAYEERIRTIRTHFTDVAAKKSEITKDEAWVPVSAAQYQAVEHNLGMAIEHKPAGKYDFEAERVAQPAGFAYIAPPGQSNQYGYWDHRGGASVWMWLPQYLILRDLMWNRYYPPMTTYEYEEYRTYRSRGQTYYGHDTSGGTAAPKYGSNGSVTQRQYADSNYSRSGGYRDSRYANKGGYRDSRYASPAGRSGESAEPRKFGRTEDSNSRPSWSGHSSPGGSRPAPRPAPSRSGGGRSFGGRRR